MSETSRIAAIRIAGGESEPFYSATLRVFYWDSGTHSDQIVKDVAGLRVLLADAHARTVEHGGSHQVHLPLMLRGYVRPEEHKDGANHGVELRLEGQGASFAGTLITDKPVSAADSTALTFVATSKPISSSSRLASFKSNLVQASANSLR